MIKYDKVQSFKCDEELDSFLKLLSKKDKRKKATLEDLKRSLDNCF